MSFVRGRKDLAMLRRIVEFVLRFASSSARMTGKIVAALMIWASVFVHVAMVAPPWGVPMKMTPLHELDISLYLAGSLEASISA
jgi:hypothetical protein